MFGRGILDEQFAARHCRESDKTSCLDVIGRNLDFCAAHFIDAFNCQRVRADARNFCAHSIQHICQVLDVRLAGGVAQNRRALREDCRHQHIFRPSHARFVEKNIAPAQMIGVHFKAIVHVNLCAERAQRAEVRVHAPPPDHIAPRWR